MWLELKKQRWISKNFDEIISPFDANLAKGAVHSMHLLVGENSLPKICRWDVHGPGRARPGSLSGCLSNKSPRICIAYMARARAQVGVQASVTLSKPGPNIKWHKIKIQFQPEY